MPPDCIAAVNAAVFSNMYRTAMREKSSTLPGMAGGVGVDVGSGGGFSWVVCSLNVTEDGVAVVATPVLVYDSSKMIPFLVPTEPRAARICVGVSPVVELGADFLTASSSDASQSATDSIREVRRTLLEVGERLLNEMSEFSVVQETLFWLKSAMILIESNGMLKLLLASLNKRGRSLPMVAFLDVEF